MMIVIVSARFGPLGGTPARSRKDEVVEKKRGLLSDEEMSALLAKEDECVSDDENDPFASQQLLFTPGDFADFCERVAPAITEAFSGLAPLLDGVVELGEPVLALIGPDALANTRSPRRIIASLAMGPDRSGATLFEIPGDLAGRLAMRMIGADDTGAEVVDEGHLSSLGELIRQYRILLARRLPGIFEAPRDGETRSRRRETVLSGTRTARRLLDTFLDDQLHFLELTAQCRLAGFNGGKVRYVFSIDGARTLLRARPSSDSRSATPKSVSASEPEKLPLSDGDSTHVLARLGSSRLQRQELSALRPGAVVRLDTLAGDEVELVVDGAVFARGEVVVADSHYAIKITSVSKTKSDGGDGNDGE